MPSADDAEPGAPLLTPRLALPVAIFLASRVVLLAVAHAVRVVEPQPLTDVLGRWDGAHYTKIAVGGYPSALPTGTGVSAETPHAFFPVFPLLIRGVRALTGLSPVSSGLLVNVALATVAAALVWLVAREVADEDTATKAVLVFSFFPGAFVLGMVYSEGTFLALAAGCLLALLRRWWVVAGLLAAVAGATRPTGLVLAACCAWAAVLAVRRRREWWALAAPALAPVGFIAWSAFLEARTGSALAWKRSHEAGWGQGFDFGANTARSIGEALFFDPLDSFNQTVCVATLVLLAACVVLLWRWRPPAVLGIYTAGIVFPAVFSAVLTSTPRFVLTAFPVHVALARSLSGTAFAVALAASAAVMALLMLVAGLSLELTP